MKGTTLYLETPTITASTPAERLQALKDARELLTTTPGETKPAIFGGGSVETVYAPETGQMLRLAEYITTGHDYKDTHPKGDRRPLIKNDTHVTVLAPPSMDQDDIEHLISHIEDGSFAEFIKGFGFPEPDTMEGEMKARAAEGLPTDGDVDTAPEDEEAHRPVDPEDRPRFGSKAPDFS